MLTLTKPELVDLTGKVRAKAQMRALTFMSIPFATTPTGEVKVLRSELRFSADDARVSRNQEPDFDAI